MRLSPIKHKNYARAYGFLPDRGRREGLATREGMKIQNIVASGKADVAVFGRSAVCGSEGGFFGG
jgi:hypothetical protein